MKVFFPSEMPEQLHFVVIAAMYEGQWIFARHKERDTYEIPGGHIEDGEDVIAAARRELFEETGAVDFELFPICAYGVTRDECTTYGLLYFAQVRTLGELPAGYEISERTLSTDIPDNLTYQLIQPLLHERVMDWLEKNKTTVYFIRHAQPDTSIKEDLNYDLIRPLTEKGLADARRLPQKLNDIRFDAIYSSPCKRAVQTVEPLSHSLSLDIIIHDDFRERKVGAWIEDFKPFGIKQWSDFSYKLSDGECIAEVQERNIFALNEVLRANEGKTIAVGTHGMALSTIINYYDSKFGYDDYWRMVPILPYIIKMEFIRESLINMKEIAI